MYIHKNLPILLFSLLFIAIKVMISNHFLFSVLTVLLIIILIKSDNYKNKTSILIFIVTAEFLMDPLPKEVTIYNVAFVMFLLCLITYSLIDNNTIKIILDDALILFLVIFLTLCIYSLTAILLHKVPVFDVLNTILPFSLILLFLFVYYLLIYERLSIEKILFSITLWGLLYSLNNISLFIYNYIIEKSALRRITLLEFNTLSPVPLFLCVISLFFIFHNWEKVCFKKSTWFIIMIISFVGMLVTQTRSMIVATLITLILIFVYNIINKNINSIKTMILIGSTSFLILYVVITLVEPIRFVYESILNRFSSIGESDGNVIARFDEYYVAFQVIKENPLLGGGVGLEFSQRGSNIVNYIHNFPLYIIVNFGLIGFSLAFLLFVFMSYIVKRKNNPVVTATYFGVIAIFIYSLFFAVFKWISFSILLALTLALIVYIKNKSRYLND